MGSHRNLLGRDFPIITIHKMMASLLLMMSYIQQKTVFKIWILDFSRIDIINKYSHLVQNYYCAPCVLWVDVAETELPNKSLSSLLMKECVSPSELPWLSLAITVTSPATPIFTLHGQEARLNSTLSTLTLSSEPPCSDLFPL